MSFSAQIRAACVLFTVVTVSSTLVVSAPATAETVKQECSIWVQAESSNTGVGTLRVAVTGVGVVLPLKIQPTGTLEIRRDNTETISIKPVQPYLAYEGVPASARVGAVFTTEPGEAWSNYFVFHYSGDANTAPCVGGWSSFSVYPTSLSFPDEPLAMTADGGVTLQAVLRFHGPSDTPPGVVHFKLDGKQLEGWARMNRRSDGSWLATYQLPSTQPWRTLAAVYQGGGIYQPSTASVPLEIAQSMTFIDVIDDAPAPGKGATVVATVMAAGDVDPTAAMSGEVYAYYDNSAAPEATARLTTGNARDGYQVRLDLPMALSRNDGRFSDYRTITVVYRGDTRWAGSRQTPITRFTVNPDGELSYLVFTDDGDVQWRRGPLHPWLAETVAPEPQPVSPPLPVTAAPGRSGYWMLGSDGVVYPFGDAVHYGNAPVGTNIAQDLEATRSGRGYWIIDSAGRLFAYGDARHLGHPVGMDHLEQITSLSATKSGDGYWIFTSKGRVFAFGDASHMGDMATTPLNQPVLDSVVTPSGNGYYMVASDGGIFSFGDAGFYGSMGNRRLNAPVQSLVADGDGDGYWLVASDGGVFAFGADFLGSMGAVALQKPVSGMVGFGSSGYLMVAEDGGIFSFGSARFAGSLGSTPPARPVTSVAVLPSSRTREVGPLATEFWVQY